MNETAEAPPEKFVDKVGALYWFANHAKKRQRILVSGVAGREGVEFATSIATPGYVVSCSDFQPVGVFRAITHESANQILLRKLRLKIGQFHTIPDSELADQFDMFVLNQPYESVDETERDIHRGIKLCGPAAFVCGTCYNNPATKEAVDKLLPFRQLFGNIWFGYL